MIKQAFSLVELMVTLIVVSIITAALAPVITKRLKSNSITVSSGGAKGLSMNCSSISPSCGLCEGGVCVSCAKSCTENEALDIPNCACKVCNSADLHGSACLKCDMENCSKCTNGYYLESGVCKSCSNGYTCDGTNSSPCPAGYYCSGGVTSACSAGTYNSSTGATSSSACVACSTKTANCTNCDIATGVCNACASGYDLASGACKSKEFKYTYTGISDKFSTTEYTRITLTTDGVFTANSDSLAEVMVLGGGGGGGGSSYQYSASCGNPGYNTISEISFSSGDSYSVTIGQGGAGGEGATYPSTDSGSAGGATYFGSLMAAGSGGGCGVWVSGCVGGSAVTFAGMTYASGCAKGNNTGTGGNAGDTMVDNNGNGRTGGDGYSGYSGIVVIKIAK